MSLPVEALIEIELLSRELGQLCKNTEQINVLESKYQFISSIQSVYFNPLYVAKCEICLSCDEQS